MKFYLSEIRIQAQEGITGSNQVGQPIFHPLCVSPSLWTSSIYSPSPGERCLVGKEFSGCSTPSLKVIRLPIPRKPHKLSLHTTIRSRGRDTPKISNPGLVQSGSVLSSCQCLSTSLNVICYCGLKQQPQLKPKQNLWPPSHGSKDSPSQNDQMLLSPHYTFLTGPDW